jgi:MYXO-CTERM domain-containing protein
VKTTALVTLLLALGAGAVPAEAQRKIVIDPGHGGQDPGGVGTGMQEKIIVLDTSSRFKALLEADTADAAGGGEWQAFITRSDDTFVSLTGRAAYANDRDADRFMSIHSNAFGDPSANGTETFSVSNSGDGAALRNLVQEEMIAAWGLTNRGNKTANFTVLTATAMPAVLHELAFITNAGDAALLADPARRQTAAEAHLKAIQRHFGIAPYIPGSGGGGDVGEIAGVVLDDEGPVAGATISLDSGQTATTPADGTFLVTDVPVGTRGLTVTAEGHEESVVQIAVDAGQRAETEVHLSRTDEGGGGGGGGDAGIGEGPAAEDENMLSGGCGCRTGEQGGAPWALLLVGLFLVWRRRR